MAIIDELARLKGELDKCVTCAVCQSVCPSFQLSHRELLSPRGRIVLLRRLLAGDIEPEEISPDAFDFCTLCYACQTACPAGVETDLLFITARKTLADANGILRAKKLVFKALEKPALTASAVLLGSLAQQSLGKHVVNQLAGGMAVPPLRRRPLVRELPEVVEPAPPRRARVLFLVGCMANYVDAAAARAAIEVLRRLHVEVITPHAQVCCGAPAFNNGDFATARRLAKRNLDLFDREDVDAVISADATCGGAFLHEIPELMREDNEYAAIAERIRNLMIDWASFVEETLAPTFPVTDHGSLDVTVHDSCHLTHTAGREDSVRRLLERLEGVRIVEMERSKICCGFGGSFSALYPEPSQSWQEQKLDDIRNTHAPVAVAASPGCIATMRETMQKQKDAPFELLHPAQLICQRCDWRITI